MFSSRQFVLSLQPIEIDTNVLLTFLRVSNKKPHERILLFLAGKMEIIRGASQPRAGHVIKRNAEMIGCDVCESAVRSHSNQPCVTVSSPWFLGLCYSLVHQY